MSHRPDRRRAGVSGGSANQKVWLSQELERAVDTDGVALQCVDQASIARHGAAQAGPPWAGRRSIGRPSSGHGGPHEFKWGHSSFWVLGGAIARRAGPGTARFFHTLSFAAPSFAGSPDAAGRRVDARAATIHVGALALGPARPMPREDASDHGLFVNQGVHGPFDCRRQFVPYFHDSGQVFRHRLGTFPLFCASPCTSLPRSLTEGFGTPRLAKAKQPAVNRFVVGSSPTRGAFPRPSRRSRSYCQ